MTRQVQPKGPKGKNYKMKEKREVSILWMEGKMKSKLLNWLNILENKQWHRSYWQGDIIDAHQVIMRFKKDQKKWAKSKERRDETGEREFERR